MDQIKIGKFIAESRKKNNMTQLQLADKLGITDRAVSKWENGKTMPDSAIMLELCDVLHITVNDLLNGEVISPENYNKKLEERLLEISAGKEKSDKLLMRLKTITSILVIFVLLLFSFWDTINELLWLWAVLALVVTLLIPMIYMIIEVKVLQQAGYYRCEDCGYTYVPTFKQVFLASLLYTYKKPKMHCSRCNKKTKHKKVFSKE